jgi:hypothetical protein
MQQRKVRYNLKVSRKTEHASIKSNISAIPDEGKQDVKYQYLIKTWISNLERTMLFWMNLHQVCFICVQTWAVNQSLLQSINRFINYVNITILMTKWKQNTDWNINMKPDILKQTTYSSEPVPLTWFHAQLVFKCIVFEATYFIHSYIGSVYGLWWHHIGF